MADFRTKRSGRDPGTASEHAAQQDGTARDQASTALPELSHHSRDFVTDSAWGNASRNEDKGFVATTLVARMLRIRRGIILVP
jgi:hypothetical protein